MLLELISSFAAVLGLLYWIIAKNIDRNKFKLLEYFELTFMLGSGGHTGQLCHLLAHLKFQKTNKINILVTGSDHSSVPFFWSFINSHHSSHFQQIKAKTIVFNLARTNQVKQTYISALFTGIRSLISSFILVIKSLINSTHFVANGPGTCVPLYYIFYILKKIRLCRTKLIFFESWCRVEDLSLSGKLVRPIIDKFIVHWPELAVKYPSCKYYGKIL